MKNARRTQVGPDPMSPDNLTVGEWIREVRGEKRRAREAILQEVLDQDDVWLVRNETYILPLADYREAERLYAEYISGRPLEYITGEVKFYGRWFSVDSSVLIPRPETEELVEEAIKLIDKHKWKKVYDVGTGSGVIAITLKLERPDLEICAIDISFAANTTALLNARGYHLEFEIDFIDADLLNFRVSDGDDNDITPVPDVIVANLPYVDRNWDWTSPSLMYEPEIALYSEDGGLRTIKELIRQAGVKCPKAWLILEADPCQEKSLREYAYTRGYSFQKIKDFVYVLKPGL